MSMYKELSYDQDIEQVKGIQFCVLSPEEILRRSVVEVTKSDVFVGNEPVPNGLFDNRMGVIEHRKLCTTCGQQNTFCPGHFGHIAMAKPVFYIQFFKMVEKLMKCVCFRCSKLLIDPTMPEVRAIQARKMSRLKKWEAMYKLCAKPRRRCGHGGGIAGGATATATAAGEAAAPLGGGTNGCGARQADKIYKEGVLKIAMEWKETAADRTAREEAENNDEAASSAAAAGAAGAAEGAIAAPPAGTVRKILLSAEDVLRILQRITDEDAELLGFHRKYNRPEWMICTILPVPPPAVRPSVRNDSGIRSEDDLTHQLSNIVKFNNQLAQKIEKGNKDQIDPTHQLLQYEVMTLIDNQIPGIPPSQQRTGRPLRSLMERLKSKEGRIRGNLMGKRVDFSARSVITPDPNISIDELGVPFKIAMNLTFPEVVNTFNRDQLSKLVQNGPDIYPGAKYVRKWKDQRTIRLKGMDRSSIRLEVGDIVDRHLRDGDYVLFNRQPSLHKMSMMGHRVRVMPYNTFRLNVCVTPCFNADFDGDEMNMHVPQSLQTHEELLQLASVPTQIISPREAKPIVSVVQDIALGVYRMTKSHVRVSQKQLFNLLSTNPKFVGRIASPDISERTANNALVPFWTGRQLLSSILPKNINLRSPNKSFDDRLANNKENYVIIENGEIKQGVLDKDIYQARTKGLVHSVFNECGPEETRLLFDNTQRLVCDWLVLDGFSVGISDLVVDESSKDVFHKIIHNMKVQVYDIMRDIHLGKFENNSTKNNAEAFEMRVNSTLNKATDEVGRLGLSQINDLTNRMINMVKSGSKGNTINVAQMIGCLGQQNVDGKRIPYGFDDRTLPHYTKYDDGPESRGFVEASFIKGLTPQEMFFHAMGGREGLIDTAVKSVTGDTPIIVLEGGVCRYVEIGDWIDRHLDAAKDRVRHFEERQMEYLEMELDTIYIPTTDEDGNVTWGELTAVTRHDPGTELYQIKTAGGKSVIVTESKSLLTWNAKLGKFQDVPTPEIRVGDYVPVTAVLAAPPMVIDTVDLALYFPKTEYIHGDDFHKAVACMQSAMQDRSKIEAGWWQKHNGATFTLPYDSKARLARASSGRSNTDNIVQGYIYPFHATREHGRIPAQFDLNNKNGIFIGLFLAEGNANIKSGTVQITNLDIDVQQFVNEWFDSFGISHKTNTKQNAIGGISTTVVGYSRMLAQFLHQFVGHGAHSKFVPSAAFAAPDDFIVGILNGYFSGDGTISKTSVESSSASQRLTEGIAMLCSRLGIFGKVFTTQTKQNNLGTTNIAPAHRLSIRAQWAALFAKRVPLLVESKNIQLQKLQCSTTHRNFQEHHDVVLDKIVEINLIDVAKYPKVYDVTVPSTLNFGLASGLQVRDTSDTGYIQRKLVKAMEDCKVNYDLSVRNASGSIVQFLYGEDGMDASKIETQSLPTVKMDLETLRQEYLFSEDLRELSGILDASLRQRLLDTPAWQERASAHFKQLLEDREFLISYVFKSKQNDSLMYPIAFQRILTNMQNAFVKYSAQLPDLDLDPSYVLDTLDRLQTKLIVNKMNPDSTRLLHILMRMQLSPKKLILKHRFNRDTFDFVVQQIQTRFYDSLAQPSEMVGVIAAQSIGEPTTQLTLNTFHMSGHSAASKAVRGVPRLRELLSITKNMKTPIMNVYVQPEYRHDKKKCLQLMNEMRTLHFRDIVNSCKIYFDPSDNNTTIAEDAAFVAEQQEFLQQLDPNAPCDASLSPWMLRLEFNPTKMVAASVQMIDVYHALTSFYDTNINCLFSDDNANKLVMRIRLANSASKNEADAGMDDALTDLKALEHNILDTLVIKGVPSIQKVSLHEEVEHVYDPISQQFLKQTEWVMDTEGSYFSEVLGKSFVDSARTITNDIHEIYNTLGIEAARQALFNEIMEVLGTVAVNYRHLALLVDTMTNRGHLLSIDRHGINRGDIGPLAKCSFEEVNDMLIKAGVFSEVDKLNGVSANMILGQIAPAGTGDSEIIIDEHKLEELGLEAVKDEAYAELHLDEDEREDADVDACDLMPVAFDFKMPDIDVSIVKRSIQAVRVV